MRLRDALIRWHWILGLCLLGCGGVLAQGPSALIDSPSLEKAVASGKLPPLAERLPEEPQIIEIQGEGRSIGQHGGDLITLMGKQSDIRMMVVYGYARLVGYTEDLELKADILESVEVEDNRIFTLNLRVGHRWSDGNPFTTEDFRYYWEDVANNKHISPFGPPKELLVDGQPPQVEIIGETTIRYAWKGPNPGFLAALAGARPLFIYRPAHYLKQFHARYADHPKLKKMVRREGTRNWAGLHHRHDHQYKADNPDLPTLQPWVNTSTPPAERFVFERNPYFHRIDQDGHQLPYLDRVIVNIADNKLVPAKTGAGDSDLQGRYLRFDNYTFLKAGEERNNYTVRLWESAKGSQIALYPNLNAADPVWRELLRDVRFRHALSLAVDRQEINEVVYYGLATAAGNTVLPRSPFFSIEYQNSWSHFDLQEANALLDEIGLTERDDRGVRKLPDGRPMNLIVETAGESTEETDILELVHDTWLKVGVKLYTKPSQREVFRNRIFSGETVMSVWSGLDNAIPTPTMSPKELAPTEQVQLQWPKWGQYHESSGQAGEAPDLPAAQELVKLMDDWVHAATNEQRGAAWTRMLEIHADQIFSIGIVTGVQQPVVVNNQLRNVPEVGIYNWDPGAYFGIYKPDTFWIASP